MSVLAKNKTVKFEENIENLREAMGIMQHHDAVTGTEKQHVANDYARLLQIGIDKCSENTKETLNQLSNPEVTSNEGLKFEFKSCASLNISSCDISENSEKFMITIYNPLAHSTNQYIRIPISDSEYEVLDNENVVLSSQIVSVPSEVRILSFRKSIAESELVFLATELPPLGYKSYFIQTKLTEKFPKNKKIDSKIERFGTSIHRFTIPFTIGNEYLSLKFDENGLLQSAETDGVQMRVRQNFYFYKGSVGPNHRPEYRSSGAYIFRPNQTFALPIVSKAHIRLIRGDLVDEVHQVTTK